jgi:glycosyltransferase involved in cell wall biosynthesis
MNPGTDGRRTVLQLTSMESTKYGGLEEYFVELVKVCERKNYGTVFQYELPPASSAYVADLTKAGAKIEVRRTAGRPFRSMVNVVSLLRSYHPQIVQTHFVRGYGHLAVACSARAFGARRLIALEHNPLDGRRTWHRRFAYRSYDQVLGVSDAVCKTFIDAGLPRSLVSTHYLGLFGDREASGEARLRLRRAWRIPDRAVVIGSLGFDTPRKGFDILLHALKEMKETQKEIHILIVGVDPRRSELPDLAVRLGVDARVHLAGLQDEGWKTLQAVDLYVQPSRSEGLPLSIMEAMALKLPVVASRVGGIAEAVKDGVTGYLVEPGSVPSLAHALSLALQNPERFRAMGDAGYQRYLQLFRGKQSVEALVAKYLPGV